MSASQVIALAGGLLLGLVLGSWLTACAHRIPRRIDVVSDRSRCPDCDTVILARDNLPLVGWLRLRGRCRACGGRIPARYPLIELACGLCGAGLALWSWQAAVLVALAVVILPTVVSLLTRRTGGERA